MPLIDTLREAHIRSHRVGHDCDKLTDPEEEVYTRLKKDGKKELTVDGLTARLEPKRFGVNWRRELLKVKGVAYVQKLTDKAKMRTAKAKLMFDQEEPNWSEETRASKRLVIEG